MAMVEEIAAYLSTQLALTPGVSLFANVLPETSGRAVGIFEAPGVGAVQRFGSPLPAFERPRIMVVARSTAGAGGSPSSTGARTLAGAAWRALIKVVNQPLPSSTVAASHQAQYLHIEPLSSPYLAERDAKGRYLFSFTADIARVATTNG